MTITIEQMKAITHPTTLFEKPTISIGQIFDVSYLHVLNEMAKGKSWPDDSLEKAYQDDRLIIGDYDPTHISKTYTINTPITWTKMDEIAQKTENQRVALVKAMLENGIMAHSYQLLALLKEHNKITVFKEYRYELSNNNVATTNQNAESRIITTAYTVGKF